MRFGISDQKAKAHHCALHRIVWHLKVPVDLYMMQVASSQRKCVQYIQC